MDNKNIYSCIEQEDGPGPCKCMQLLLIININFSN